MYNIIANQKFNKNSKNIKELLIFNKFLFKKFNKN